MGLWLFLVALMAVLGRIGHKALGARRWIKLGPMQFQPSEWVKLVLILVVARYFANLGGRSLSPGGRSSRPSRSWASPCCWF